MKPYYSPTNKITERAAAFDACVCELSDEAQIWLSEAVKIIAEQMAGGGGEKSAKELLFQLAKHLPTLTT